MNHAKVLARFIIVLFWLLMLGLIVTMMLHSGNVLNLSWITFLVYGAIISVVTYVGFFVSKYLWSIK